MFAFLIASSLDALRILDTQEANERNSLQHMRVDAIFLYFNKVCLLNLVGAVNMYLNLNQISILDEAFFFVITNEILRPFQ